jgi:hypothetical protein
MKCCLTSLTTSIPKPAARWNNLGSARKRLGLRCQHQVGSECLAPSLIALKSLYQAERHQPVNNMSESSVTNLFTSKAIGKRQAVLRIGAMCTAVRRKRRTAFEDLRGSACGQGASGERSEGPARPPSRGRRCLQRDGHFDAAWWPMVRGECEERAGAGVSRHKPPSAQLEC